MRETQKIETIRKLPILGVCGWSGSGKTTLIETVLPRLLARNLRVVVVKHDVHSIDVDRTGKDSDRFFQAGGDVFLQGNEELSRRHPERADNLLNQLLGLVQRYDLILVEGHKQSPLPKVWLLDEEQSSPPASVTDIKLVLQRNADRAEDFFAFLVGWLSAQWLNTPVYGCITVKLREPKGGNGVPLSTDERNRLELAGETLRAYTQDIVVVSKDPSVDSPGFTVLPPSPDVGGPLAGLVTAMRWHPLVSWLTMDGSADCKSEIWKRILYRRTPGVWGVLPPGGENRGFGFSPSYVDFRAVALLENVPERKHMAAKLAKHPKIITLTE